MTITLGFWDFCLIVGVTLQATVLAYLHSPRLKALALSFPIPFSLAFLALGRPVDTTNVLGMSLLILYMHAIRLLHTAAHWPIVAAIAIATVGYGVVGALAAAWIPTGGETGFWIWLGLTLVIALGVLRIQPPREEPSHRSALPVWIKLGVVAGIVLVLVIIKHSLKGFMTMFPMVSIVAAYEARHSLWTMSRQIPIFLLATIPMIGVMRLVQPRFGAIGALAVGWCVFLAVLWTVTRWQARRGGAAKEELKLNHPSP